jgi:tRNA(adenine34) deaminase
MTHISNEADVPPEGTLPEDEKFMEAALDEARRAYDEGEVPVGAVVVWEGGIVSSGHNRPIGLVDPTAHAEVLAIRGAAERIGNYRLVGATLYVTLEPCILCAGAILAARLSRLVYGASDPKGGAVGSLFRLLEDSRLNHRVRVQGGVLAPSCREILYRFFQEKRIT